MEQINGFAGGMMGGKSWGGLYEVASVLWFQVLPNDKLRLMFGEF
jgi:hypothetical protein